MTSSLKGQIQSELAQHAQWFTTEQLIAQMGIAPNRYSTVARALRKLRAEGSVQARWCQRSRRYREWSTANNSGQAVVPATPKPVSKTKPATGFKGSPRSVPMCTPSTKPTLVDSTKTIVTEFVAAGRSFSAYDVTTELRERANSGKATIDPAETGLCHVGGKSVPKIGHDDIKGIVHDLHHNGEMTGYDRVHTGSYWQYAPAAVSSADSDADSSSDDSGNGTSVKVAVIAVGSSKDYDGSSTL